MGDLGEASDAQLVTLVARYDEIALAEVYRRHGGAVFGLARRVLNNQTEAEDVTQEIFLRLWNQPERFDPARGTLRSYLLTQAHARAVDVIRSLNSSRATRSERRRSHRECRATTCTAKRGTSCSQKRWCERCRELPIEERRAIELAYFEGHTYVEVAQILHEPEGTVKGRIRNGMRRMRGELSRHGIEGADR